MAQIADKLDISFDDSETRKRIAQRLQPFVDTVLPNRTIQVSVGDHQRLSLGKSKVSYMDAKQFATALSAQLSRLP